MDETEQARAQRVWQRVLGEPPGTKREWLARLMADQMEDAAVYRMLARQLGGRFQRLYEQKQAQLNCLRGIWRIFTGTVPPSAPVKLPSGSPEELLRRCIGRQMQVLQAYDAQTREPEFGPVYASLREAQKDHCRLALELLGSGLGRR